MSNGASPPPDESVFAAHLGRWCSGAGGGELPDARPREKRVLGPTSLLAGFQPLRSEPSPAPSCIRSWR